MFLAAREAAANGGKARCKPCMVPAKLSLFTRAREAALTPLYNDECDDVTPSETPKERRLRMQMSSQRERRRRAFVVKKVVTDFGGDITAVDNLVSKLMQYPEGLRLLPGVAGQIQQLSGAVRTDALANVSELTSKLPQRSRFKKDIVGSLAKPTESFSTSELHAACGVSESYTRVCKHRASKVFGGVAEPLFQEKLRGFKSAERESCSQLELDSIVAWARKEMVVKSGCHTEKFRLQQRKRKLYEKFQCAYPRLLREIARRDDGLEGSLHDTTPITIFQRNIRRAQWLAEQDGFEEGRKADDEERSRLQRRIATDWKRGRLRPKKMIRRVQ
jgi:hypothetical protein